MQGSFGGETFTFSLFLVLCNRLTTMTVAFTMLLVRCTPALHAVLLASPPLRAPTAGVVAATAAAADSHARSSQGMPAAGPLSPPPPPGRPCTSTHPRAHTSTLSHTHAHTHTTPLAPHTPVARSCTGRTCGPWRPPTTTPPCRSPMSWPPSASTRRSSTCHSPCRQGNMPPRRCIAKRRRQPRRAAGQCPVCLRPARTTARGVRWRPASWSRALAYGVTNQPTPTTPKSKKKSRVKQQSTPADPGQVRQDDPGHDLGHHHPQEALQ